VPAGYINGTRFFDTPGIVDAYYSSFLLEGLAKADETELAQDLLDATWGPMVRRDSNYTGAYWEYVVGAAVSSISHRCVLTLTEYRRDLSRT